MLLVTKIMETKGNQVHMLTIRLNLCLWPHIWKQVFHIIFDIDDRICCHFIEVIDSAIWIEILIFTLTKMCLKTSPAKMAAILSRGRWVNIPMIWLYTGPAVHSYGELKIECNRLSFELIHYSAKTLNKACHVYTSGRRYGITHTLAAWVHI